MKLRWFITLMAIAPFAAALMVLQSCGGEGGPTSDGGGGLPAVTQEFLALLSSDQAGASYIGSQACVNGTCHGGTGAREDTIYQHWQGTKHAEKGVSCERCHGPGSIHAANPTKTNVLTFPKLISAVVCAQCHGPIFDEWESSKHSELVMSPVDSMITSPATTRSSRCAACHSGLLRTQYVEGGVDLGTLTDPTIIQVGRDTKDVIPHIAVCATCHDPHSKTGNLTAEGEDVQLRHKTFNQDTTPVGPGSLAASFTTFNHSCAECHNGRGADPSDTKLASSTSRPNMHDSNQFNMLMGFAGVEAGGPVTPQNTAHASIPGQCSKCHMPDHRHTYTVSFDTSCAPCHTATDAATRVNVTKSDMVDKLFALRTRMENWALAKFGNRDFWDYSSLIDEVYGTGSAPSQSASSIPIQLKRARHNYYFVIRDGSYGVHNGPYARHLMTIANINMDGIPSPTRPAARAEELTYAQKLAVIEADRARAARAEASDTSD